MILPPVTMEEQIADLQETDDAKDIWLAVKARFGGNEESKKMRKSMLRFVAAGNGSDGVSVAAGVGADGVSVAAGVGADGVFVAAGVGADSVSVATSDATDAETEFALMGLSPQAKIDKMNNQAKLEESNARFDKWKESSKNLVKLINSSL
ncbi:hypothetical protein Tco_0186880 [Tanacetum coccineum]